MKLLYTLLLCLLFVSNSALGQLDQCYPDKGIKSSKTIAKRLGASAFDDDDERSQEIQFDNLGRPLLVKNPGAHTEVSFVYEGDKLKCTIVKRVLPSFYNAAKRDSLLANPTYEVDTNFVVKYDKAGRPAELKGADGNFMTVSYKGCKEETKFFHNDAGKIVTEDKMIKKDGVLVQTVLTFYEVEKTTRTTDYYAYEYDDRGHWIRRKYQHQNGGEIAETRELVYY